MKQGRGMCSTFQSFPVISANVPSTYYVHREIYELWYVHVPRYVLDTLELISLTPWWDS